MNAEQLKEIQNESSLKLQRAKVLLEIGHGVEEKRKQIHLFQEALDILKDKDDAKKCKKNKIYQFESQDEYDELSTEEVKRIFMKKKAAELQKAMNQNIAPSNGACAGFNSSTQDNASLTEAINRGTENGYAVGSDHDHDDEE